MLHRQREKPCGDDTKGFTNIQDVAFFRLHCGPEPFIIKSGIGGGYPPVDCVPLKILYRWKSSFYSVLSMTVSAVVRLHAIFIAPNSEAESSLSGTGTKIYGKPEMSDLSDLSEENTISI